MTAKDYTADESRRIALSGMLASPTFQDAWDIALKNLIPGHANEGAINPNIGNAYLQQITGAQFMLTELEKLTTAREKPEPQGRRLFREEDREFLQQQLLQKQQQPK